MRRLLLVVISILLLFVTGCKKNKEEVITFDDTYPLSLAPDVEWALVTDPYTVYKADMDWNSEITGHCRRGEILQVLGKSVDKKNVKWYEFEHGWLPQNCLTIYTNRYKAQKAAESLQD